MELPWRYRMCNKKPSAKVWDTSSQICGWRCSGNTQNNIDYYHCSWLPDRTWWSGQLLKTCENHIQWSQDTEKESQYWPGSFRPLLLTARYQDAVQTARGKVTNSLTHVRLYLFSELQITTGPQDTPMDSTVAQVLVTTFWLDSQPPCLSLISLGQNNSVLPT